MSELRCQDRYWRQYAECICGQEDYVLSCRSCGNRANDFFNMIDRVRYTGVLCYALISEVDFSVLIQSNVLKQCVTFDCVVDVRFRFIIQVDNFCVASTFEVEYAVVIPAVLVITDQQTFRVCRQCSLTCSGQTEEDCCVLAVHVCVCGAVHGSDALSMADSSSS